MRVTKSIFVSLLLSLLGFSVAWAQEALASPCSPGAPAPSFQACDRLGNQVELKHFAGRPMVLAFLAFWCDTWKPLLADLKALPPETQVVLMAVDSRERAMAEPAMVAAQLPFPLLIDVRGDVVRRYGVTTVPTLVVIDAQGQVRYLHQGFPGLNLLRQELASCSSQEAHPEVDETYLIPEERRALRLIVQERHRRGLPALALDAALTDVARERLQRMLETHQLSHYLPEPPDRRLRRRGYSFRKLAENLAEAPNPQQALAAMLNSPSHKANLLHPAYRRVGVAALRCGPQGFIYAVLLSQP